MKAKQAGRHPNLPTSQSEKAEAYLRAMLEIRARLEVIEHMKTLSWPIGLRLEVSYLQLRAICDLITVGAIISQGDYGAELGSGYAPGPIFREMERKYPSPFPQPTTITMVGGGTIIQANAVPNAMTKSEMLKLWALSGDRLHRLKVSKFFRSYNESYNAGELNEIDAHVAKIHALLDCHGITIINPKALAIVWLYGEAETGTIQLSFLEYGPDQTMKMVPFSAEGNSDYFEI